MTIKSLTDQLAERLNMSKTGARQVLDTVFETVLDNTITDGECSTPIGKFKLKDRKERQGVNPQTKAVMNIPAKKVVTFKSNSNIASAINTTV